HSPYGLIPRLAIVRTLRWRVQSGFAGFAHLGRLGLPQRQLMAPLADSRSECWIAKNCRVRYVWCNLLEQFRPLSTQAVLKRHKAGSITARSRQTLNEAGAHGIGDDRKDNRDGLSGL